MRGRLTPVETRSRELREQPVPPSQRFHPVPGASRTSVPLPLLLALGLGLCSFLLPVASRAQDTGTPTPPPPPAPTGQNETSPTPAPTPAPTTPAPTPAPAPAPTAATQTPATTPPASADIEAQILQIEANAGLDEETKKKVIETYRTALAQLKVAEGHSANLMRYRELVEAGPEEVQRIRAELRKPQPPLAPYISGLEGRPQAEIDGELTREQAKLATAQARRGELSRTLVEQEKRPAAIREEIAKAQERLLQIDRELQKPPAEAGGALSDPRTTLLKSQKHARTVELQMLEQELVIFQTRLNLITAQRDLVEREIVELEARIKALRDLLERVRREEAERQRREAEQARLDTLGKHPTLVQIAEMNSRFSQEFAHITGKIESASRTHQRILQDLKTVEDEHKSARTRLERVGLSGMLGEIFLEQRKKIPRIDKYRQPTAEHRDQISEVRLGQINVDERRRELVDLEGTIQELVDSAEPPLEEWEVEEFSRVARVLLGDQIDLLSKVDTTYGRYLKVLSDLDIDLRQLGESVSAYRSFLDDHLLWTPSASMVNRDTVDDLGQAVAWLVDPGNWLAIPSALISSLSRNPVTTSLGVLILGTLVLTRRRSRLQIESLAQRVKRKVTDRYSLTLVGILLSTLLATPLALLVALIGWLLKASGGTQPFVFALGTSLLSLSVPIFMLQLTRRLCMPRGICDDHFRWRDRTLILIRRSAFWILVISVPTMGIVLLCEAFENDEYRYSLGRLGFTFSMIVIGVILARLFAPGNGIFGQRSSSAGLGWLYHLRWLWMLLVPGAFFALAIMAIAGYYYTARQLDHRVLLTAITIAGAVLTYHLILRWLVIARTRLAIDRAREKREAALAATDGAQPEEQQVELEIPEINLVTVKEQAQRLFGTAILFSVALLLLAIWAPVLPALAVLDRELWQVHVQVGGEEVLKSITITSLLFAFLTALLGIVASRNLPGLLELAVLRKLSLDPGSRYAIATIGQYLLVTAGVALALKTLGVAWSHIQWLVAALSVGLGFGLQEIFANFVSGLIILLERPIRVGDTVTVGDISGTVTRIKIRATTITDWDHKELVVPNKSFITGQLINWSLSNAITRLIVRVGIAYGSDTEKALRLMLEAARSNPSVLNEPEPNVFFVGFGDSSLNFEVRIFVKELTNNARTRIRHEIHMAIDRLFRENDVVIAFPQLDLHVKETPRSEERPFLESRSYDLPEGN